MGNPMNRGEVWWAEVRRKRRPVLVLTRPEVIDVRELVTVRRDHQHRQGSCCRGSPAGRCNWNLGRGRLSTVTAYTHCDGLRSRIEPAS